MRIIGVIPARYESTRFPGKPLADICGKPMIWWVYQQVKKVQKLSEVYVATDDERIVKTCELYDIKTIMTSSEHKTVFSRVCEVAKKNDADFYVIINGDEPLIDYKNIEKVIPDTYQYEEIVTNIITQITDPVEVNDISNIKVVFDKENRALYMSRTPVPFPNKRIDFQYWKHVGITGMSASIIKNYDKMPIGNFESIEGIDHLRFIDNGNLMYFIKIDNIKSLSVDTPKDLEKVRQIIEDKYGH